MHTRAKGGLLPAQQKMPQHKMVLRFIVCDTHPLHSQARLYVRRIFARWWWSSVKDAPSVSPRLPVAVLRASRRSRERGLQRRKLFRSSRGYGRQAHQAPRLLLVGGVRASKRQLQPHCACVQTARKSAAVTPPPIHALRTGRCSPGGHLRHSAAQEAVRAAR